MKLKIHSMLLTLAAAAIIIVTIFMVVRRSGIRESTLLREIQVLVEPANTVGPDLWVVDPDTVEQGTGDGSVRLARLINLRVEKIGAHLLENKKEKLIVRSKTLRGGDLLVRNPAGLEVGQAVAPGNLDGDRLLRLTIQAGVAGLEAMDLSQSLRFFSPDYRDSWGFNHYFIRELLKRAYREFDALKLELAADPEIRIRGTRAMVQARVRLTARYRGRTNYLLGGRDHYNTLVFQFENGTSGWKVTDLQGLRPLGFEERFFRLLGGDIGLPLNKAEREEKKEACMPCRDRMAERFGPYRKD